MFRRVALVTAVLTGNVVPSSRIPVTTMMEALSGDRWRTVVKTMTNILFLQEATECLRHLDCCRLVGAVSSAT
jgi:hypothetical protein